VATSIIELRQLITHTTFSIFCIHFSETVTDKNIYVHIIWTLWADFLLVCRACVNCSHCIPWYYAGYFECTVHIVHDIAQTCCL